MSCLEKVVAKIENKRSKCYENLYLRSDGMVARFRSHFVFKLLAGTVFPNKSLMWFYNERHHGKGPMDGQMVINSPQEFSEAVKSFLPSINAVYLPESESIIEPKDIECAKKIKNTMKVHKLERKVNANGNPFYIQW